MGKVYCYLKDWCWSIIRKIYLWHSNDLNHIVSIGEIPFKSHNIATFHSLDSDVINLCNRKFKLHRFPKKSVIIIDLKSVSVIKEICKSVDSTILIVSTTTYALALISYLNSIYFFEPVILAVTSNKMFHLFSNSKVSVRSIHL